VEELIAIANRESAKRRRFDGSELQTLRRASGRTVTDIASAVAARDRTVERWESGRMAPRGNLLARVERVLEALASEAEERSE